MKAEEIKSWDTWELIACEIDTHFAVFGPCNSITAQAVAKLPVKFSVFTTEPKHQPFYGGVTCKDQYGRISRESILLER